MPTVVTAGGTATLRRVVTAVLERAGYQVVAVEDGLAAVQAVLSLQPDAAVLDVALPRLSGPAATRLLKGDWRTADLPVLLLTPPEAATERFWALRCGADEYLAKDFEAPDLVAAVCRLLAERPRPLRPEPLRVDAAEVLSRACDLLDRALFEASVTAEVTNLASSATGPAAAGAALLATVHRLVEYDAAVLLLGHDRLALTAGPANDDLLARALAALESAGGPALGAADVVRRTADPPGDAPADPDLDGGLATVLTMPLRAGGQLVGVLGLGSARAGTFGECALAALRVVAPAAALVLDNARLAADPV